MKRFATVFITLILAFIMSLGILSAFGCEKEVTPDADEIPITNPSGPEDSGEEGGGDGGESGSGDSGDSPVIDGDGGSIDGPIIKPGK